MILQIKPLKIDFFDNRSLGYTAQEVLEASGADIVFNGSLYDMTSSSKTPNCDVRIHGKTLSNDAYGYWGFGWQDGDAKATMAHSNNMTDWYNYISCLMLSTNQHGKLSLDTSSVGNLDGYSARPRTAFGYQADGTMIILVGGAYKILPMQDLLVDEYKCVDSINLDGGGSSQLASNKYGSVESSRIVSNYICVWVDPNFKITTISATENEEDLIYGSYFHLKANYTIDDSSVQITSYATFMNQSTGETKTSNLSNFSYGGNKLQITLPVDSSFSAGKWTLTSIKTYKYNDDMLINEYVGNGDIYFNVIIPDTEAPVILNISSDQTGAYLYTGDSFQFEVDVQDASDLTLIEGVFTFESNEKLTYKTSASSYDLKTQTALCTVNIEEDDFPGKWTLKTLELEDLNGNNTLQDVSDYNIYFYTVDENDTEAPVFEQIYMENKGVTFTPDSGTEQVLIKVSDDSPLNFGQLCFRSYEGNTILIEDFTYYQNQSIGQFIIDPKNFSENVKNGYYYLETLVISDTADNMAIYRNSDTPKYFFGEVWFIVDFPQPEPEPPVEPESNLKIVSIYMNIPGMTLTNDYNSDKKIKIYTQIETDDNNLTGTLYFKTANKDCSFNTAKFSYDSDTKIGTFIVSTYLYKDLKSDIYYLDSMVISNSNETIKEDKETTTLNFSNIYFELVDKPPVPTYYFIREPTFGYKHFFIKPLE